MDIVGQTATLQRVAVAVPEARREHDLSQRQFAALSGVSATTVRKLERGGKIDSALLVRLGATIVVLDAYRALENDGDVLLHQAAPRAASAA